MVTDRKIARKFLQIETSGQQRGIHFDMSLRRVAALLRQKTCFFTGVELNDVEGHPNQRSFDRIDNDKGYIDTNVVACTATFNKRKNNLTVKEIVLMYKGLKKKNLI